MPLHEYPGNGPLKQKARHVLYQLVQQHVPPGIGQVLTLAGPQAPEVPFLRDILRISPQLTWFVDTNPQCLRDAQLQWPAVRTHHGDILEAVALQQVTALKFVNLDYMGQYTYKVAACVRGLSPKLVPNAVVALTWKRGMERSFEPHMKRILDMGRFAGAKAFDDKRLIGIIRVFAADLQRKVSILDYFEYRNGGSSMSNLIVKVL